VPRLIVDWTEAPAARRAVELWHYSGTLPASKSVRCGAWIDDRFVGCVVFSMGQRLLSSPYGLSGTEVCELSRVALDSHDGVFVTQIVSQALRLLRVRCPGLRLVVSFADPAEGHVGGIYQAGNWIYAGTSARERALVLDGSRINRRAYTGRNYGAPRLALPVGARWVVVPGKHRYLMPLDKATRRRVELLRQPYPRADAQVEGAGIQPGERCKPVRPLPPA